MKTPAGLLAPIEETAFELEPEDRERLEELRREKAEKARRGKLDTEGREAMYDAKQAFVSRIRKVDPNEWADGIGDDWAPGEFEAFCKRVQAEQADEKEAIKRALRPLSRGGEVSENGVLRLNGSIGSNEPTAIEQKVLDHCHRVAPEGSRPVTMEEIASAIGYSASGTWKVVNRLKQKALWLDGWTGTQGRKPSKPERTPTTLDELPPNVRKIHDTFEHLSPGGCRPVRQSEVAQELGVSPAHVCKAISLLRAAGLFRVEWEAVGKHVPKKPPIEKSAKAAPVVEPDAPPPDSPAARSLEAHATKHRITADERRLREAHAERETPVACEVRAKAEPATSWKAMAIELHEAALRVLEALPDDRDEAWMVLEAVNFDIDSEVRRKAVSA